MLYECDECGLVEDKEGVYAPAHPGDPPPALACECGGVMSYIEE